MDGLNIPCHYFDNKAFANSDFLSKLEELQIDFVILAGFLRSSELFVYFGALE